MRLFSALNGQEVEHIILSEIRKAMDADEQFRQHLTYPKVEWEWEVRVKVHDQENGEFSVSIAGAVNVKQTEPLITVLKGGRQVTKTSEDQVGVQAPDEARQDAGIPMLEKTEFAGVGFADAPTSAFDAFLGEKKRR